MVHQQGNVRTGLSFRNVTEHPKIAVIRFDHAHPLSSTAVHVPASLITPFPILIMLWANREPLPASNQMDTHILDGQSIIATTIPI